MLLQLMTARKPSPTVMMGRTMMSLTAMRRMIDEDDD
jgi:hypothetical protein